MDLWIRSQNKKRLLKINNIKLEEIEKNYSWYIDNDNCRPYVLTSDEGNLGFYTTKERALEVLDEIQNILNPKFMLRMDGDLKNIENFLDISNRPYIQNHDNADIKIINNSYVYEMPEE